MSASMMARVLGLVMAGSLLACAGEADPGPGSRRAPIVGGELDEGDPAVVSLELSGGGGCTGTLISPRMVLTAAHCTMEAPSFGKVSFGTLARAPIRTVTVSDSIAHPTTDLRLVKLSIPVGDVEPLPINRAPLSLAALNQPLRQVGFGLDGYPDGVSGTKRQATLIVTGLRTDELVYRSADGLQGACFGDSGGPGLMSTEQDPRELVVGVASHLETEPICTGAAANIRVDTFSGWIDGISAVWELQSCAAGDACRQGCVPVDPDCFCVHDAVCDLRCPKLSLDPDCDPACDNDAFCSSTPCQFPDPDCVAPGATCSQDAQCQSRTCASQAGRRFCSRGCSSTAECPAAMYCSPTNRVCLFRPTAGSSCLSTVPCGEGSSCANEGDGGQLCRATCQSSADCPAEEQCLAGSDGPAVCRPRVSVPPPPVPRSGCGAVPGDLWVGLGALLALRRRSPESWPPQR